MDRIYNNSYEYNNCKKKEDILIKPGKLTRDHRALTLSFRSGTELIKFKNLLEKEIPDFKYNYYTKAYNLLNNNSFFKNIGINFSKKIEETYFCIDFIIVSLKGLHLQEIVDYLDNKEFIKSIDGIVFSKYFRLKWRN